MRKFTAVELSKILKEHERWYDTDEDEGEKVDLRYANLSYANLSRANLLCADLSAAILMDANMSEANLSRADLSAANLFSVGLMDANLSRADLIDASLSLADLSGANLTQVENLSINQLSEVKTLYKAELDPELKKQVKDKYPHLLEELEKEKLINPKMTRYFGISIKSASEIDKENEEDYEEEDEE